MERFSGFGSNKCQECLHGPFYVLSITITSFEMATTERSAVQQDVNGTPRSELSEEEGGVSSTTVTTELIGKNGEKKESVTITHQGVKGISHKVDKDGAVHLLPKRSGKTNRIRTLVSFKARESHFDRFNKEAAKDPFRGFYTLFWISLMIFVLNTFYNSFTTTGQILSLTFATLFSRDAIVLAISDGVLIGSLFICVPFAKVLVNGWCRYYPTLIWFQHVWQACLLGIVIKWSHYRDWPWVQSGFFVLHTLSMLMKIHSYMAINGHLADTYHRMKRLEDTIEERVADVEGIREGEKPVGKGGVSEEAWKRAVEKAAAADESDMRSKAVEDGDANGHSAVTTDDSTEAISTQQGHWDNLQAQRGTSTLRQRANSSIIDRKPSVNHPDRDHSSNKKEKGKDKDKQDTLIRDPHPLATHPDPLINSLAREVEFLREELTSNTPAVEEKNPDVYTETVTWPSNVTFANFLDYLLVPTLVYELSYPRLRTVRPLYLLEKALATFGTFFVIYVITEHWIMPRQPSPDTPLLHTFLELAVPMMLNYLLIFYIMFECICQFFAEWTGFADRLFYEDWWNATSMDVFSRRWNRPVHSFLLRHVYASSITAGLPKGVAMFVTFLLSSLLHELVMAIVSGKIRGYLFAMQMAQLPLIFISQIPFVKRNETLGNIIFWTGLLIGFPMLNIAYITY